MDALTFIVETLKAAAWPLVTIVLAALFRSELRALLGRLKKGKVGAAELEFAEAVNELKAEVAEVSVASPRPPASARLADLAVLNPRAALMAAWTEIEMHLLRLSRQQSIQSGGTSRNPVATARELAKAGVFPLTHLPAIATLRQLRNQAAHDPDFNPTAEAAIGYVEVAEEIKGILAAAESAP